MAGAGSADDGTTEPPGADSSSAEPPGDPLVLTLRELHRRVMPVANSPHSFGAGDHDGGLPNLILEHREALHRLAPSAVDARVVDLVGQVFEEVLADRRVPPEMAREIARLQLPVLRLALKDSGFFRDREHPARRLIDRLASLAAAEEDQQQRSAQLLLTKARRLVGQILEADFGSTKPYEHALQALERTARDHARLELERRGAVPSLLEAKEDQLLAHREVRAALSKGLATVETPDYVRSFIVEAWSQVMVDAEQAARRARDAQLAAEADPVDAATDVEELGYQVSQNPKQTTPEQRWLERTLAIASEWILGLKPKAGAQDRQQSLAALPGLLRDAREGARRLGIAPQAQQAFLHRWMPERAQALKQPSMRDLDHNLLSCELKRLWSDALALAPLAIEAPASNSPAAAALGADIDSPVYFASDEARRIGWLPDDRIPAAVRTFEEVPEQRVRMVGAMAPDTRSMGDPSFAPTWPEGWIDEQTLPMPMAPSMHAVSGGGVAETTHALATLAHQIGVGQPPTDSRGRKASAHDAVSLPSELTRGAELADHLQVGQTYLLLVGSVPQHVRLAYRSPRGGFVVFNHGAGGQESITMTSRAMRRACESGRLKAYEADSLIERAGTRILGRAPLTQPAHEMPDAHMHGQDADPMMEPPASAGALPRAAATPVSARVGRVPPAQEPATAATDAPAQATVVRHDAAPQGIDRWLRQPSAVG